MQAIKSVLEGMGMPRRITKRIPVIYVYLRFESATGRHISIGPVEKDSPDFAKLREHFPAFTRAIGMPDHLDFVGVEIAP